LASNRSEIRDSSSLEVVFPFLPFLPFLPVLFPDGPDLAERGFNPSKRQIETAVENRRGYHDQCPQTRHIQR
jgi:hypothetical protein